MTSITLATPFQPPLQPAKPMGHTLFQSLKNETLTLEGFHSWLKSEYGEALVDKVLAAYPKTNEISKNYVKERLIGIAATVRKEDLIARHQKLNPGGKKFESLTPNELEALISHFRTFENKEGKRVPIAEELFPDKFTLSFQAHPQIFHYHLRQLRCFEQASNFQWGEPGEKQELATSEFHAREVAYCFKINTTFDEDVIGTIIPTLDKEGNLHYYEVKSGMYEKGIIAFNAVPVAESEWNSPTDCPLKVFWQGTNNLDAWKRDFTEGFEAGRKSFDKNKEKILAEMKKAIPEKAESIDTEIFGHSLGSADAQRNLALIAETQNEAEKSNPFLKIKKASIYTWNSPRIMKKNVIAYNKNREELIQKGIKTTFSHTHLLVDEDLVQTFGHALLGWVPPKAKKGKIDLLEQDSKFLDATKDTRVHRFSHLDLVGILGVGRHTHTRNCLGKNSAPVEWKSYKGRELIKKISPPSLWDLVKQFFIGLAKNLSRIPRAILYLGKKIVRSCRKSSKKTEKIQKKALGFDTFKELVENAQSVPLKTKKGCKKAKIDHQYVAYDMARAKWSFKKFSRFKRFLRKLFKVYSSTHPRVIAAQLSKEGWTKDISQVPGKKRVDVVKTCNQIWEKISPLPQAS